MMAIVYPMFAMVVLTFVVGINLGMARLVSVRKGEVKGGYYRLMRGDTLPDQLVKLARNYANLFEAPILFYVVCILALVVNSVSPLLIGLAWVFVGARVVHTLIHLTYNNPLHRFVVFLLSNLVLLVMWVLVGMMGF